MIAYVFVVDVILRFTSAPRSFITSPWDVFDALVVFAYAIAAPLLVEQDSLAAILVLRSLRVLRFHRFLYAMSASGGSSALTGGPSRRERLVMCCQRHVCCGKLGGDKPDEMDWAPPPRGMGHGMDDDPIAAIKASRETERMRQDA